MSIKDQRAALEAIACSSALDMDARLDSLCEQPHPIQDILVVAGWLRTQCSQDAYLSCLRLLLERRSSRLDRSCILKALLAEAGGGPGDEPLLHPVVASIVADHTLLPCLVPLLAERHDATVRFLFSVDADALMESGALGWARAVLAKKFAAAHARHYIRDAVVGKQIAVESVLALHDYIEDRVAVMLALSSSMQPLLPELLVGPCEVSNALLALLLHVSLHGLVDDYLSLLGAVKHSTLTFEAVKCLSTFVMSARHPNDDRIDCAECVLPPAFDPRQLQLKRHVGGEDRGFDVLLGLLDVLSGAQVEVATTEPLLVEVTLRCLVACISGKKQNREWCIVQLAALARHTQTVAESVVAIAEILSNRFPELQYPILSAMAANSASLPVLQFILARMEKAYQSDVEHFFKLAKFVLDNPNVRQSTLDSIACRLKDDSAAFSTPVLIAGCLEVWRMLAQLHYISPECVYVEIVMRNNWPQSNDPLVTAAFIDFCSTLASLPHDTTADEQIALQPVVIEALKQVVVHLSYDHKYLAGIGAIKHTQHTKKKAVVEAVFRCLSRYEPAIVLPFLDQQGIKFDALMTVLFKYECTECTPQMRTVLGWYLEREIRDMPRSLFLGTFDGRIHVPHVIGGLLGALLTMPSVKDINLAHLDLYPWFMKMDLVSALRKYYQSLLSETSVESVLSVLNSLDNAKESVLLWSFSMAALQSSSPGVEVTVEQGRMERLRSIANEDAQFALECLNHVLGLHAAPVDSMPRAMACALFGPPTPTAHLAKRLQLPFAYLGKQTGEEAPVEVLLAEEDYHAYLLALVSRTATPTGEQLKLVQRKSTAMAVKEPLDMQGSVAFFSSRLVNLPVDLSVNMNAMPAVRQVQIAAAAAAVAPALDTGADKLIAMAAKARKLLPFVDLLVYNKYRPGEGSSPAHSGTGGLLGSIERFPQGSVFRSLVLTALPTIPGVALGVLSAHHSVPVLEWLEHLTGHSAVYTQPALVPFLCKHLYCDAGSARRLNQSIVGTVEFLFRCGDTDLDVESLRALLAALPQDLRHTCIDMAKDRKLDLGQLSVLVKYSADARLTKHLLDNNEMADDEAVVGVLQAVPAGSDIASARWRPGLDMLRAAQRGALVEHVNSVDCSAYPRLLAHLFKTYGLLDVSGIINRRLRDQIEAILA